MTPARAFVVAPTPMLRAGIRAVLAAAENSSVEVVGDSGPPDDLSAPGLPASDVVVVADEDLLDEVALAVAEDGTQALILLSEDERAAVKLRSLPLRGWGVVPPDAPPEEIGAAVAAAAQGLAVVSRSLADGTLVEPPGTGEELPEPPTAREGEVLGLLAQGLSNKQIARELHISEHTVKFHISSLYTKLGVGNRAEAVSRGARHGLISL